MSAALGLEADLQIASVIGHMQRIAVRTSTLDACAREMRAFLDVALEKGVSQRSLFWAFSKLMHQNNQRVPWRIVLAVFESLPSTL